MDLLDRLTGIRRNNGLYRLCRANVFNILHPTFTLSVHKTDLDVVAYGIGCNCHYVCWQPCAIMHWLHMTTRWNFTVLGTRSGACAFAVSDGTRLRTHIVRMFLCVGLPQHTLRIFSAPAITVFEVGGSHYRGSGDPVLVKNTLFGKKGIL